MPKKLFPFRYRDELTGKWVRARYLAERHEIAERYKEWEIVGPPEIRGDGGYSYFRPYPPTVAAPLSNVDRAPGLEEDERSLVLVFLRRYVTYCARRQRYAQMQGAASLFSSVRRGA
jgi:hypothetical protein